MTCNRCGEPHDSAKLPALIAGWGFCCWDNEWYCEKCNHYHETEKKVVGEDTEQVKDLMLRIADALEKLVVAVENLK